MIYDGCSEFRGNANGNNVPRTDVASYKYDRWSSPDQQTVIIISHSACVYHDILIASAELYTSDVHRMTILFSLFMTKRIEWIWINPLRLHFVSFNLLRSLHIIFLCSIIPRCWNPNCFRLVVTLRFKYLIFNFKQFFIIYVREQVYKLRISDCTKNCNKIKFKKMIRFLSKNSNDSYSRV